MLGGARLTGRLPASVPHAAREVRGEARHPRLGSAVRALHRLARAGRHALAEAVVAAQVHHVAPALAVHRALDHHPRQCGLLERAGVVVQDVAVVALEAESAIPDASVNFKCLRMTEGDT